MIANRFRTALLGALAAPLALGLAACSGGSDSTAALNADPIALIAPPEGKAWSDIIEKTEFGGYRMGNPTAPIKLVEYASTTCPHCKHFTEEAEPALRENFVASGRVSYEFRNFILNPLDLAIAMTIRCGAPESFMALTEQTFAGQEELLDRWSDADQGQLQRAISLPPEQRYVAIATIAGLPEFFAARGIAEDQTRACLADGAAAEALVKATEDQGEEYDITGTPSFLINGQKADINTWPEIKTRLEQMGAR